MRGRVSFPVSDPPVSVRELLAAEARSLLDEHGRRAAEVARRGTPFRDWAVRVPEPRGPLDFSSRFAWQAELYSEAAAHDPEMVIQKGTQMGISAWALRWVLFHADVFGRVALYTFPAQSALNDFSRERVRPLIRGSHLRDRIAVDAVDTVGQRQIGAGWLYMRGTNKPIESIAADVVCFDELDYSVQENIEASEHRVSGPMSAGLLRRVGVPTIPGFGISAAYEASDMRAWTVRCEACNHWNRLLGFEAFEANVDQDELRLVCADCRRPIDVTAGEWVAAHPDRGTRGYHVPKLLLPDRKTLRRLVENSRKTRPDQVEAFFNRDLGQEWAPAEGRLSLGAIRACVRDDLRLEPSLHSYNLTAMGVDMASARALNVVIEDQIDPETTTGRKVFVGTINDTSDRSAFDWLCWLMDAYSVNLCGIDNEPDGRFSRDLAARFPGRVYRMDFYTPQPGARTEATDWRVDDEAQFCALWRTRAYDATFERFRMQRVLLPPLDQLPPDYPTQLGNLYRRTVETPHGNQRVEYVRTGPEDFAQAEAYCFAAIALYWRNSRLIDANRVVPLLEPGADFEPLDLTGYDADGVRYGL